MRVRYMHSDIDTLERIEIIRDLRLGAFDVLVGINLLREGLDIPECALVAILDADKEGFLRSRDLADPDHRPRRAQHRRPRDPLRRPRSPARWSAPWPRPTAGARSRTPTTPPTASRRRASRSQIGDILGQRLRARPRDWSTPASPRTPTPPSSATTSRPRCADLESRMREAAADLEFEEAARLRDEIKRLRATELAVVDDPTAKVVQAAGEGQGRHAPHKPHLDEMGIAPTTRSRRTGPARSGTGRASRRSTRWVRARRASPTAAARARPPASPACTAAGSRARAEARLDRVPRARRSRAAPCHRLAPLSANA